MKTNVTLNTGRKTQLFTDDTLTLAFPYLTESTPATLRARVSERSLRHIAAHSTDRNEVEKANAALALQLQLSDHGMGKKSAQVFEGSKLVLDWNLEML
jgi:hypothetical protein